MKEGSKEEDLSLELYGDIIDTRWPPLLSFSRKMELNHRAKIFLPFAALTGYEEAIEQAAQDCNSRQ